MTPERFTITFNSNCQVFLYLFLDFLSSLATQFLACLYLSNYLHLYNIYIFSFSCAFVLIASLHSCDMIG